MSDPAPSIFPEITTWYMRLQDRAGDRAQLRRCENPFDAVYHETFHHLRFSLRGKFSKQSQADSPLPHLACLLAHVKKDTGKWNEDLSEHTGLSLGEALAKAEFSKLRFRRLINNQSRDDLFLPLMRAIHFLKGQVNVVDLARIVLFWNERTRRNMASDYYNNLPKKAEKK